MLGLLFPIADALFSTCFGFLAGKVTKDKASAEPLGQSANSGSLEDIKWEASLEILCCNFSLCG